MKKILLVPLIALLIFTTPVFAETDKSVIDNLLAKLAELQARVYEILSVNSGVPVDSSCLNLSEGLGIGSGGNDVVLLQNFLRVHPESSWPAGQIATGYFGEITSSSVENFRQFHDLEGSGVDGVFVDKVRDMTCASDDQEETESSAEDMADSEEAEVSETEEIEITRTVPLGQDFLMKKGDVLSLTLNDSDSTELILRNMEQYYCNNAPCAFNMSYEIKIGDGNFEERNLRENNKIMLEGAPGFFIELRRWEALEPSAKIRITNI